MGDKYIVTTHRAPYSEEMRQLYPSMMWEIVQYRRSYIGLINGTQYMLFDDPLSKRYRCDKTVFTSGDAKTPKEVQNLMLIKELQFLAGILT